MKVLLHICCGVCAAAAAERLMIEGHQVTGFFYNPNIHPQDEYQRRLESAREVAKQMNFELVEPIYDRENWFTAVKGLEYEAEGGERCVECFRMRLQKTYDYMKKKWFDRFTTTLTVGPMKDADTVNRIGMEIGGDKFILADYKKKGGFQRAVEMAKEMGLYRQDYCGCIYSKEEAIKKEVRNEK